jgi:signal transduction histidine kinase
VDAVLLKEFREKQKMYSESLATFQHDYRGMLGKIFGFTALIIEENKEDSVLWENIITDAAKQLREVFDLRMLLIKDPVYEKHDILNIINAGLNKLNGSAEGKKIVLKIEDSEVGQVFSDRARMDVWLHNFLENAAKFTLEGGEIVVSSKVLNGGYRKVSVTDTGIGIPENVLVKIQGMFSGEMETEKMDSTRGTNGEQGTGKGLRNCADLMKNVVGAKLEVESVEGQGATLSFIVPATEEKYNEILQEEKERVETVYKEVPLLIQGILSNAKKREVEKDEEKNEKNMKLNVEKVLDNTESNKKAV